ncbi:unnamed protein product [Allacma fusca]|uniref:Uncharacterized protein n=1 Tax=Allacma fusca TaxID=39272 RepID=A0A8J2M2P8_9HEXA|nr:unnamed protein product [Allacma fusca]
MESPSKEEKPLTIDKAAFLLLRVRKVFKKKVQLKKEKKVYSRNSWAVEQPRENTLPVFLATPVLAINSCPALCVAALTLYQLVSPV